MNGVFFHVFFRRFCFFPDTIHFCICWIVWSFVSLSLHVVLIGILPIDNCSAIRRSYAIGSQNEQWLREREEVEVVSVTLTAKLVQNHSRSQLCVSRKTMPIKGGANQFVPRGSLDCDRVHILTHWTGFTFRTLNFKCCCSCAYEGHPNFLSVSVEKWCRSSQINNGSMQGLLLVDNWLVLNALSVYAGRLGRS